jgi:hypothetical protein
MDTPAFLSEVVLPVGLEVAVCPDGAYLEHVFGSIGLR